MSRFPWRYLLAAVGVAWAFDLLFWGKPIGISFPLWVFLALAGGIILAWSVRVRPSFLSIILMVLTVAFALITFIRSEPYTRFMNACLTFFVMLLLTATFRTGNWLYYRMEDYFVAGFRLIFAMLVRPVSVINESVRSLKGSPGESKQKSSGRRVLSVIWGLLLALPVVLVLGILLASADPIFKDRLAAIININFLLRLPEYLLRLFYIVFILGYLFTGVYVHALFPKSEEPRPDHAKLLFKPFLGWIESGIVLLSVNLLFSVFVVIQFQYFFGGEANITAAGYTYSDYARRGFGELVAVAMLSLLLYLALGAVTKQETRFQRIGFTVLSVILMGLVLVILTSAYQRLYLYEGAYGFTRLRTFPHVFMIWLGVLLLAAIVLELIRRRSPFALALLLTSFGFCLTLGIMNVDGFIVNQNIQRVYQGEALDAEYLQTLSSDAVPAMVQQYLSPALPQEARDVLGAELSCRTAMMENEQASGKASWGSFHLGEETAIKTLRACEATWQNAYPTRLSGQDWVVKVNNTERSCRSSVFSID